MIIDVFRAFSVACHAVQTAPQRYAVVGTSIDAARQQIRRPAPFLIGKPEIGADLEYDIRNRVRCRSRRVVHVMPG